MTSTSQLEKKNQLIYSNRTKSSGFLQTAKLLNNKLLELGKNILLYEIQVFKSNGDIALEEENWEEAVKYFKKAEALTLNYVGENSDIMLSEIKSLRAKALAER